MEKFQILYFFDSSDMILVETKRLDLSTSASLSEIYKWTAYFKADNQFVSLHFRSMTDGKRSFQEGELKFDEKSAEFIFKGTSYPLMAGMIHEDFSVQLQAYLLDIPKQT